MVLFTIVDFVLLQACCVLRAVLIEATIASLDALSTAHIEEGVCAKELKILFSV